jgi:chromosome segregation ATPase
MARIDFIALQQRLAQQQPTPVPAEPSSWSTRPAPASALRTTPAAKARPATASAGTLRATTTMRAALPLDATNARAERVEERARVNALRAQIDELNAEMVVARAAADRTLAGERQRADRLSEQVGALQTEIRQAEARVKAERARADALRTAIDELKAGQAMMTEVHGRELAVAQHDAQTGRQAAAALRQAEVARKAKGLVARLRAAWRAE